MLSQTSCEVPHYTVVLRCVIRTGFQFCLALQERCFKLPDKWQILFLCVMADTHIYVLLQVDIRHYRALPMCQTRFMSASVSCLASITKQFWSVLCRLINCKNTGPFSFGIYYRQSKPLSANAFFEPVVCKLENVLDGHFTLTLLAIVCDVPDKPYIISKGSQWLLQLYKVYHWRWLCEWTNVLSPAWCVLTDRCFIHGIYIWRASYTGDTILKRLPVDMVKEVSLDYMYMVCAGLVRKLLVLWFKGTNRFWLRTSTRSEVSARKTLP